MSTTGGSIGAFSAEDLELMAFLLEEEGLEAPAPDAIPPRPAGEPAPLSFAQQRLWFIEQLEPGSGRYNVVFPLGLRGPLDVRALRRALSEIVRRHESLRTRFPAAGGEPVQAVDPPAPVPLPVADLAGLRADARERELRRAADAQLARPFDLAAGPLFRPSLLRRGEEEWALLLNVHHIVYDGWSIGVLHRELSALYPAFARGEPSPLPEPSLQYADYAVWQRERLGGEALDRQVAWWKERLADAPPVLELPTDHPRPAVAGTRGAARTFAVPERAARELHALTRREGATAFMTVLAAWQLLLARWSGQDDVVVGTPVAGRTRTELEGLIGFFVNTLALRADLSGTERPTFRELLGRVREATLGAYANQDVPFERLVEELQVERTLAHTPLFQAMLVVQGREVGESDMGDVEVDALDVRTEPARFDLLLNVAEAEDSLAGMLTWRAELWEPATMERMLAHFAALLQSAADAPDRPLSELEMLGAGEREQVLRGWNATQAEYPAELCVHHLFEAQARRTPDAPALAAGGETLTYAGVDERAERLAALLRARGVGPDVRVGLCLERSAELVLSTLAVLKAGGAYVPLDPAYPAERLAFMLADSGARVLVTTGALAERFGGFGGEVLAPSPPGPLSPASGRKGENGNGALTPRPLLPILGEGENNNDTSLAPLPLAGEGLGRGPAVSPDNLAYVIYTSGSTGTPKGVALAHRPLVNLLAWQERGWCGPRAAVTLQFATISFDASFHEIFSCWAGGGTLVVAPEPVRADPAALLDLLEREGIERLFLPYVALQHLAEEAVARGAFPRALKEVQTAGEQLRVTPAIREWLSGLGVPLHNHYGPSETHVVTALALDGPAEGWPLLPSIGGPIANTRCYVLDRSLAPAPSGAPGELYLGGACLARGYLDRPALTADRFVPDPYAPEPGERMYRSGDRARWLADGTLEFLGRVDQQVKVRGFRIEPGEVEAALERHPAVREAVVVVRADASGDRRLVAYAVPADGASPAAAELRAHLAAGLPEYMVPAAVVVLDALPLTPSGKTDRLALPAPDFAAGRESYAAPRTPTEATLAAMWAEVLGVERVGIHEGFFALGGHSLLATRVVSRLRGAFGVELPVRALFEAQTVASLAARVDAERRAGQGIVLPPLLPAARGGADALPLSFAQERLWVLQQLDPASVAYNIPSYLRLRGPLDAGALGRALAALVARHESLRTVFPVVDGRPVQRVAPAAGWALAAADLSALPEHARAAEALRRAREATLRPYDLAAGPLFHALLLRLGAEDHLLAVGVHHVVIDGWSLDVVFGELDALYGAFARGEPDPLPPPALQYADFAAWQRGWLDGATLERQTAYWRERLAGAPPLLELPTDRPRTSAPSGRRDTRELAIPAAAAAGVRELARREGATLFMAALAAFQALLARYAGQDDVLVGTPVAGRNWAEVEGLVGFFVNTLVLRAELGADTDARRLLRQARERTLEAQAHQDVPFERLVDELQVERSLSHTPLFQVLFSVANARGRVEPRLGELEIEPVGPGGGETPFDLSLVVIEDGDRLVAGFDFQVELFDAGTIERMAEHFRVLLEGMAADPDLPVAGLPLLSAGERTHLLETLNATAYDAPRTACVHDLFAAQAARTPDAPAVLFEDESISYAGLDASSSRLAAALRARGVAPEVRAAICVPRGPEMALAILAVLKAGGAYVPLDPDYPAERLSFLLADSAARLLLTTAELAERFGGFAGEVVLAPSPPGPLSPASGRKGENGNSALTPRPPLPILGEGENDNDTSLAPLPLAGEGLGRGPSASPDNLAYVIYTSGSTGRPKGAMVPHRAVVNYAVDFAARVGLGAGDRVLQFASPGFDVVVEELFPAWASGGAVVFSRGNLLSPAELLDVVERHGVTAFELPTAYWHEWVHELARTGRRLPECVRFVIVGGERVLPERLAEWAELGTPLVHVFGLTETACTSTTLRLEASDDGACWPNLPVGAPTGNVRLYVLDRALQPAPLGVPGELWIAGDGVGRGYLGRPELTAERFVPDPYAGEAGARAYRTGDRVRWLADGNLEFLGRIDQQVKVRGFRIEPAEIEAALAEHPAVRDAAVVVREAQDGDRRLVAYLTPAAGFAAAADGLRREPGARVELWPSHGEYPVYDDLLYRAMAADRLRNEGYLEALRQHAAGKTVVDVGTGGEIVLTRLAIEAGARHVYAVEVMEESFRKAEERVRELGLEDRVTLIRGDATTVELPEPVDVCVSELIGCIGGSEGAVAILEHARRWLAPDGVMIPRRCVTRVAAATLPHEAHEEPAFTELGAHYAEQVFAAVGHRDDVRLCVRGFPRDHLLSDPAVFEDLDFARPADPAFLHRFTLQVERDGRLDGLLLWIQLYPGERLAVDALEDESAWLPMFFPVFYPGVEARAGDVLRVEASGAPADGAPYPDYHLRGVLVRADGAEEPFAYDSFWKRPPAEPNALHRRIVTAEGIRVRSPEDERVSADDLRERVRGALPDYMVPSALVFLDELPRTPNGKLDRRALPDPEPAAGDAGDAPRTPTQEVLAGIWADVLRAGRVGVGQNFFALGGHSLLATRIVSRVREAFGVELPLRALFEAPTVEGLAARVDALRREGAGMQAPPVVPVPRDGPLPLSFAQQRLWFLDQLEPGSATYNVPMPLRLRGRVDVAALRRSLTETVRRHEVLRTRFPAVAGEPVQAIDPPAPVALPLVDLAGLGADAREAEMERLVVADLLRPFDLARGPLVRPALLRLGGEDAVLLLSMHHAVSDGWSAGVLFRELSALYEAFAAGRPSPLPDLPVQYADFAVWQREWLAGDVLDRQLAWWRERLADAPPLLELPTDRPRAPIEGARAAGVGVKLSEEASRALRELSRREGATAFMTLLAAWHALLGRWSGQDDVVMGSPLAGRTHLELEGLVGFFINTLVLRTGLHGDPTFRELVGRVREATLGAYAHQDLPFERLVEGLGVERSLTHTPLFQAMFDLEDARTGAAAPRFGAVQGEPVVLGNPPAKFDVSLGLVDDGRALAGGIMYRTDLWERATTERMAAHLVRLAERVAADPDARLSAVDLLGAEERRQVLEEWNGPAREVPGVFAHQLFAAAAARVPDAAALVFRGERLSYGELERRANRLANHLRGRGVGAEARVGVMLERTPELVVALLAVLKAGGAYVPLDPALPRERLGWMLEDAAASPVLTTAALAGRLPEGVTAVALDALRLDGESAEAPEVEVGPESLSHVIFTSGSTGRPKGVMVRHGGVATLLHWLRDEYTDAERSATLFATSASFDVSVAELFGTLCWGGTVVLVEDALELAQLPAGVEVRAAGMVPTAAAELLRAGGIPASVRTLNLAGEALSADLARATHALGHVDTLRNLYGPTEYTTFATHATVEPGSAAVAIGRPLPNTRALVLDAALRPAPPGIVGELYLAGDGLARGYAGSPELTAERFLPDPFGTAGSRMYRVLDRARWTPRGELEYHGRADAQVKVRGFRVEPGEVEAALRSHPAVGEAVVVARGQGADRRLAAYYTADGGPSAAELREHLRRTLPEHMVPSALVRLDALPRTGSGKLDRRALPAPDAAAEAGGSVAPRTPTEEVVAGIWATVLGVERVGAEDGFFALGGHSLLATRVVARIRRAFGVELPLRALFESPTVAALAARVDGLRRAGIAVQAPPLVRVPRDGPLPLSFAQQRLWIVDRMEPGSPVYNLPFPLRLRGPLDAAALERALGETVRRHEALRTVFAATEGEPVQRVLPPAPFVLPRVDLSALAPDAREAEARRLAEEDALRPFDLARGPLLRAALLLLGDGDAALLLDQHHVVSDGWSMGVLTRELGALYDAFTRGAPSPLPELAVQYADFAVWQRGWLAGEVLDAQLAWWREALRGAPPLLELPTDRPRRPMRHVRGAALAFALPAGAARELRALARREGATLFMALLAGWQALLARWAGQDDVVVGSPVAGRTHLELESLVGFFVNTLALRGDLAGDPAFGELLGRAREATLGAFAHQEVPFERLVEELAVERSLTHTPLFQAVLSLQDPAGDRLSLGPVLVEPLATGETTARFDLVLALGEDGDGIAARLTYRADLWDAATMERMLAHLGRLLEGAAADPARRLSEVPLLTDEESAQLLAGWSGETAEVPDLPVHERISAWAERTPDAPAVVWDGGTLSFAELEARSNRLAHHLRARGVGPDSRVGIALERSPEAVVAVLGVLGAGAAYLALDLSHPDERLRFVLEDAGAEVVVTRAWWVGRLAAYRGVLVALDTDAAALEREPADAPRVPVDPRNLAYVIYTSGSTGAPKGVLVEHRGLANYLAWFDRAVLGAEGFALPLVSRLSFDAHVRQLFPPLLRGEPAWVLSEDAAGDPAALLDALGSRERASFGGVPSLWSAVLDAVESGERPAPRDLRAVLLGGEALPAELVRRTRALFPEAALWNHYGPTEATVNTTAVRVQDAERVVLGTPLDNVRVYLLDAHGTPVPTGVPGELYVGGAGVARGYLGRPELTAATFLPDPFAGEAGARMYRSGDRVRRLADGALEYLGRADQQVKVRGFRIELGEVEAALAAHPAVREAAAAVREQAGERVLAGYVVVDGESELTAVELRAWLGSRLPEYMVPGALVFLDALPRTPSGKTDRRALPAPDAAGDADAYVAPRTPSEEVLAALFGEVLGVARVGARDGFFALGGHSLAATILVARVRRAFGAEVPLRAVFEAPTVAELAARVEESLRGGAGDRLPPLRRAPRDGPLPLSFAQQRLWFVEQLQPGSAAYNLAFPLRLRGPLDPAALRGALSEIVRRHEVLRSRFLSLRGEPAQTVDPAAPVPLPLVELAGLAPDAREDAARDLAADDARRPFDLARGPLLRAALLRLGGEEWVLLLTIHHIVYDGWSGGIFNSELSTLYEALSRGRERVLPEPELQYADYAAWQRSWLAGEALERQLAYWRAQLAGAPPLLELPTDRPRPAVAGGRGAAVRFLVPPRTARALQALARREGATLFMALLAAWQTLLAKYSGEDDVVVGAPIAGRTREETEGMIGFFVNTLALRADLSGDPAFTALLARVREATLGAYAHQDVPFERLVEELGTERSLAHTPLFQSMFAVQNHERTRLHLGGVRLEPFPLGTGSARFDLGLTLLEGGDELVGALTYRTDLWDAATAERMAGHFGRLLESVAGAPEGRLFAARLHAPGEREQVLRDGNDTAAPLPALPVHLRFAEHAARTPDAAAVVFGAATLTYAELDARAERLAARLRGLGVGPEVRVGVCVERGPELPVAVLATWKAGGAYVPLDPQYPADRLAWMLADSAVPVLLTQSRLLGALPEFEGETVLLDRAPSPPGPLSPASGRKGENDKSLAPLPLAGEGLGRGLAYVIYTSGSTGTPKGVLLEHGALANYLDWFDRTVLGDEGFALPLVSRLAFDASIRQLLPPLLRGEAVWILPEETVADPAALAEALDSRERVSFGGVPTLWSAVLEVWERGDRPLPAAGRLRAVLLGGEALPPELVERTRALFPGAAVWNHYGPTEATVNTTVARVDRAERVGIGGPIANVRVYLLDAHGEPVPSGVPGELYVAGAGVSRGYHGRPELTAERFVPDPFSGDEGARMYRSGDRVRRRADGGLEYVGRMDQQVKVRGFRIEPGEIEAALLRHPSVREAAVLVREDAPGERRLVGYVAPADGDAPAVALREHLRAALPEYMVPGAIVAIDALPLTPNGKLDRRALPAPDAAAEEDAFVAPRTPAEEVLAGIWADVLGLERVGVTGDFFALGGHSLLATRVVSRAREAFGVELPLRALFEAPTVAGLAARVEELTRAGAGVQAPPIVPIPRDGALPLSFAQQRLWFLDQLEPGGIAYNVPTALRLRGPLDAAALGAALTEVVRRHEVLRTRFPAENGQPVQTVEPPAPVPLPRIDLAALPAERREDEVRRRITAEARTPFDLASGPLLRAALLLLGPEDAVLLLDQHHVVTDGWSTGVLTEELSVLYDAFTHGRPSPLPPLPVQYADFAAWQRSWLSGATLEGQLAYWREALRGAPPLLELPTDRPRAALQGDRGTDARFAVSREAADALRALARREGATLFMTLLAAWQALLARWSGQDDVVVGSPIANRTRVETEPLVGFFVNALALRADLTGGPTFRELLGRVRETTLGAYAHQDLPFEKLVEELGVERSLSYSPVFQVMFTLTDMGRGELRLGDVRVEPLPAAVGTSKFDLNLQLAEWDGRLVGGAVCRAELWDVSTVERMLEHFRRFMEGVAADPSLPVHAVPLLDAAERWQLLVDWNDTARAWPDERPVHEVIAARAAEAPDAVAVHFEGASLTRAGLDRRASSLAAVLRARGVGPEVPVGLCLERGPAQLAAVLAVLRAGGAYVPLDPAYPPAHLGYVLEDAGVRLLLAEPATAAAVADFAGEVLMVDTPHPPAPSPTRREGEHDCAEDEAGAVAGCSLFPVPCSLAYVIYTSGSTGRPKGVRVQHGSLANLLRGTADESGIGAGDVVPVLASYAFDIWAFEALMPLMAGAAVRIVPRDRVVEVERLAGELAEVTALHAVPALMRQVAAAVRAGPAGQQRGMRRVFVGGDAVAPDLLDEVRAAFPAAEVRVLYGPTEATVISAAVQVRAGEAVGRHLVGRPLPNVVLHVLDRAGEPVPVGVAGELCVGGAGVARDYLGRPELTAERFVPDPFGGAAGARLYRTGDRACRLPDGTLAFLGRVDAQVKIRGFRIEPGEVEARLSALPGVHAAAVLAREDTPGERRLAAYVVPEEGAVLSGAELRQALRAELPEHMVPAAVVVLDALPLTPNGKVDARALPAPDASAGREYTAPRSALEEALAGIWAEVLGVERVGVHDSFFDLGGHSLLATQLVARTRVLRVEVPVRQVFQAPTVGGMAEWMVRNEAKPGATEMIAGILLKMKTMTPGERAAALSAKQPGGAS